jgi:lysozyme
MRLNGIDVSKYQGQIDWAGANGAGLITGAYHILRPSVDLDPVRAQARLFLRRIGEAAEQTHYLPAVLDVEASAAITHDGYAAAIRTWIAAVEADARFAGRPSIIYTRASFWREIGEPVEFSSRPLWVADYSRDPPRLPAGWAGWRFFQWTSKSKVAGIDGDVDGNYFDGSLDALRALAGPARIA